jgi:SAM-dependent methyltransferase
MDKDKIVQFYEKNSRERKRWKRKNLHYHHMLERYFSFIVPQGSRVLELGCGTGELLNSLKPSYGVGVDISPKMLEIARDAFPDLHFLNQDVEYLDLPEPFDYVLLSDLVGSLHDVQAAFARLHQVAHRRTRIVISYTNYLWEPLIRLAERLGLKLRQPLQNWLSPADISSLLQLESLETIRITRKILLARYIPGLDFLFNRILANLPFINRLCLVHIVTARPQIRPEQAWSTSIIIPARNEQGNIEKAVKTIPSFGAAQEIIFVEGHSRDGTLAEMHRVRQAYPEKEIRVLVQSGAGKGNAVREGFAAARHDILMILDADLTTPPEDLPKFYQALQTNRGEFINGCRLVYPMESEAMRLLNLIANKFFGVVFTWLLEQRVKDTLCGTKVMFKSDYELIGQSRGYFGEFDPFGDFDLLFGAAKLNLKIVEIIVRYRDREYGSTQISRFRHGWLLFKMTFFGMKKIKFY